MQPIRKDQSDSSNLKDSLGAYFDKRLGFDQLRTQWIIALADNPEMCNGAVRLLYQQPSNSQLTEEHTLSLKRIVEAAAHDGPDDWTVVFEDEDHVKPGAPPLPAVKLLPGHVLKNHFVLEEKLGSGGVGIVFRAHDRLLQRAEVGPAKIALKVLREEFRTSPELLEALQREAGHAQGLSHPNIVRVYDFHQDGGTYFVTMELLKGELLRTLLTRLRRAPVSKDRAFRMITGMCRGLAYAHEHGVVHADFKPGNVILTAGDEPKILDFGLAQVAAPFGQKGGTPRATSKALRAVTPAYASCNRLEGGSPGFSDDVYSLSCVIYELLAGQHPYDRKSALVARALNLTPERIDGLTDLQWRTLATGLKPSREHRTTQVHDLQVAFSPLVALQSASIAGKRTATATVPTGKAPTEGVPVESVRDKAEPSKTAKAKRAQIEKMPVKKTKRRKRTAGPVFSGVLLGTAVIALAALAIQGMQSIPLKYFDTVRESELLQSLLSAVGLDSDKPAAAKERELREPTPDDESNRGTTIAESVAPQPIDNEGSVPGDSGSEIIAMPVADAVDAGNDSGNSQPADVSSSSGESPATDLSVEEVSAAQSVIMSPGFLFDASEYFVPESAAALAVQISRQGDLSDAASVEWSTFEDSAQSQLDYVGAYRSLASFAAGEKTTVIFIPIVSDANAERDESFQVALSRPYGNMILAHPFTATVTIVDDDL